MVCPLCDTEARISSSKNVLIGDKLYRRVFYSCRNKNCKKYNTEIGHEDIEIEYEVEEASE